MSKVRKFYEKLFNEKVKPEYKSEYESRRRDFIHKYFFFFLNPYKNTRHEIVKKILPSGERYLDIGCWTGDSTLSYGVFEKFKEVYAVEVSENAASEANKKGLNVSLCDINIDNLPYPDNFFDCVTFIDVIEHLFDPYHPLQEIKRVLKPNGILIIGTANVSSLSNRLRILAGRRPRTSFDIGWDGGHLLYFTPKDLKDLLNSFGFEVMEKYATGNLQWLRKLLFSLTGEFIFKCRLNK
ncbi:class I SAM-dependent methyltransferase [Caldisericum sp.]|uniref:class I SAM-dependent methyltransferase n=1 Tax=Caldisericum sp. TaxID=2499687 RepID=UPI003D0D9431